MFSEHRQLSLGSLLKSYSILLPRTLKLLLDWFVIPFLMKRDSLEISWKMNQCEWEQRFKVFLLNYLEHDGDQTRLQSKTDIKCVKRTSYYAFIIIDSAMEIAYANEGTEYQTIQNWVIPVLLQKLGKSVSPLFLKLMCHLFL